MIFLLLSSALAFSFSFFPTTFCSAMVFICAFACQLNNGAGKFYFLLYQRNIIMLKTEKFVYSLLYVKSHSSHSSLLHY